jgi:hypothetical protein
VENGHGIPQHSYLGSAKVYLVVAQ